MATETISLEWARPSMLTRERERMGLGVTEVAARLKLPSSEIYAWETGEAEPSLADLRLLAQLYLCPVGHFFLDAPLSEESALDFRGLHEGKVATLSYESRKRLRQFTRLTEIASDWTARAGGSQEVRIPALQLGSPEVVANRVRELLGVTPSVRDSWRTADEAFAGWRAAIERLNVLVFAFTLKSDEVRGASIWPQHGLPGILVNHSDVEAATGRAFTLLHEFTHLLVRRVGIVCDFRGQPHIETFANRVASRAIVPPDEFDDRLSDPALAGGKWTDKKLDILRQYFHASRDTVAILLEERGLVPFGYYRERRAAWEKRRTFGRGGKRTAQKKPARRYRELGSTMSNLALSAAGSESASPLDIAEVLDMPLHRLAEFAEVVQAAPAV